MLPPPVLRLMKKGVRMPAPFSVDIGAEVDPARISGEGVVFYGGTKIYGAGDPDLRRNEAGLRGAGYLVELPARPGGGA